MLLVVSVYFSVSVFVSESEGIALGPDGGPQPSWLSLPMEKEKIAQKLMFRERLVLRVVSKLLSKRQLRQRDSTTQSAVAKCLPRFYRIGTESERHNHATCIEKEVIL